MTTGFNDVLTVAEVDELERISQWSVVHSSNIYAVCWRHPRVFTKTPGLGVWFLEQKKQRPTIYFYPSVPRETYYELLHASSKGRYFNQFIKGESFVGPFSHDDKE